MEVLRLDRLIDYPAFKKRNFDRILFGNQVKPNHPATGGLGVGKWRGGGVGDDLRSVRNQCDQDLLFGGDFDWSGSGEFGPEVGEVG